MILCSVGPGPGALSVPRIAGELTEAGRRAGVILEPGARHFVGPAAFAGVAQVLEAAAEPLEALVFAPAVAGTLARLARGVDGGSLLDAYAAGVRPVFVVPDLDGATAANPAVRENLQLLRGDGCRVLGGDGEGMVPANEAAARILGGLGGPLSGLKVLVTAGGTREPMDSIRFVGNRSSGKMGLAVAREALRLGAEVSVVAANVEAAEPGTGWLPVETVDELREAVLRLAEGADALVMAAAVSDFTPAEPVDAKIRRGGNLTVEFTATTDILKAVRETYPNLYVVGFAATHGDPVADAREKLGSKGVDLVVGNDISRPGIGFGPEENEVYVVDEAGERFVPRASKREVARVILDTLAAKMTRRGGNGA